MVQKRRSRGVTICGVALILLSLNTIIALLDFNYYLYLFQYLPKELIIFRYFISWMDRSIEFILGVGILCLNDMARKLLIATRIFIIVTIHLKHPLQGLGNHIQHLGREGLINIKYLEAQGISFQKLTWMGTMGACAFDILIALFLIYFFTRPKIRAQFQPAST